MRHRLWQWLAVAIPVTVALLLAAVMVRCDPQDGAEAHTPALSTKTVDNPRARFTEATYNVYVFNHHTAADVAQLMARASVIRLQEVQKPPSLTGVAAALASHPTWRAWWPRRSGLPILWNTRTWAKAGPGGALQVTARLGTRKPSRYTTWVPLRLKATGQVFLIVNVHAMALACALPIAPLRHRSQVLHWAALKAQTTVWRGLGLYDAVVTGGDFNCQLTNRTAWWMPANQLAGTYRLPPPVTGYRIDHIVTARGLPARVRVLAYRYTHRGLHSDHHALLRTVSVTAHKVVPQ